MVQTKRQRLLNDYRKKSLKRKASSKVSLRQGGVNGAHAVMRPAPMPPPSEIKYYDWTGTVVPATSGWYNINSVLVNPPALTVKGIQNIRVGAGPSDRIGRNIRIVGIVMRGIANTDVGLGTIYSPYTIDALWDNQCNGALATVAEIYTTPSGLSPANPLTDKRFQFIKRVNALDRSHATTMFDYSVKCNKVIEYKSDTGDVKDLSSNNLIFTMCAPSDAAPQLDFYCRVLYVDA